MVQFEKLEKANSKTCMSSTSFCLHVATEKQALTHFLRSKLASHSLPVAALQCQVLLKNIRLIGRPLKPVLGWKRKKTQE